MGKQTTRAIRKQLEERAIVRKHDQDEAKQRRLNGFKPVSTNEMLKELGWLARSSVPRG